MAVIHLNKVNKHYIMGTNTLEALKDINLEIDKAEFVAVVGPSGSGKSTLMNIIGCIDKPSSGFVTIENTIIDFSSLAKLSQFRSEKIGFIFQSFNLIPVLNAFENVEYPLLLTKLTTKERRVRVEEILEKVGLKDYAHHKSNELSGGQKQRIAIARSLVNKPLIVLADEPSASLDTDTSKAIMQLMKDLNHIEKTTFLITTHDPLVRSYTNREILIKDGSLTELMKEAI